MRVVVSREVWADSFLVWFVTDFPSRVLVPRPGELAWDEFRVAEGSVLPRDLALMFRPDALQALVEAVQGEERLGRKWLPSEDARDALRDAREVRDRLLSIVERGQ